MSIKHHFQLSVILFTFVNINLSYGYECFSTSIEKATITAQSIFIGIVSHIDNLPDYGETVVSFRVIKNIKNPTYDTLSAFNAGQGFFCGKSFVIGKKYLVYINRTKHRARSIGSRTTLYDLTYTEMYKKYEYVHLELEEVQFYLDSLAEVEIKNLEIE